MNTDAGKRKSGSIEMRVFLIALLSCMSQPAAGEDYSHSVSVSTVSVPPFGTAMPCKHALNFEEFDKLMSRVGWSVRIRGYPDIDWQSNLAVVIAPAGKKPNEKLAFAGLQLNQEQLVLSWRTVQGEMQARNRVRSTTRGLRPMQDILVVEFPRSVFESGELVCQEIR